jgi:molecular chaperone GrpE
VNDLYDDEALLDHFRQWLAAARAESNGIAREFPGLADEADIDPEGQRIGLYRLIEEFTALRQEIKLQTRSARGVQDQAESLVEGLGQAIEQFRSVAPRETEAAFTAGRPLAKALAELDEALERGRTEIEKGRRRIVEESPDMLQAAFTAYHARQSWLRRWLHRSTYEGLLEVYHTLDLDRRRGFFESLLEGYDLIHSRLKRTLQSEGIARVPCVGHPVDPQTMTVLEVIEDSGQPPGTVVDELRRGYTWLGRTLRYAEVRAARSFVPEESPPRETAATEDPTSLQDTATPSAL